MILTSDVVTKIEDDLNLRLALAKGLTFTEDWVKRLGKANKPNGPLTTVKAVQIIQEETKLEVDKILVDEKVAQLSK
jgi:hypothetical protein